jgi:hypothetical protein
VKLGDLVSHADAYWLVTRYDPKRTRTATLLSSSGTLLEIPHDEAVTVIANPGQDWPFVAAPLKPTWGAISRIVRPTRAEAEPVELTLYRDWLPSEPARAGGSIFFNPNLRLQIGDYLLAKHANGKDSSIVIPAHFGTVRQKQARAAAKPRQDRTAYSRLLDDDQFEDD